MKRKQYTGYTIALLLLVLVLPFAVQAQSKKKVSKPDLENWTDEQLDHWEDSVLRVLYPSPEIKKSSIVAGDDAAKSVTATNTSLINQKMMSAVSHFPSPSTNPKGLVKYRLCRAPRQQGLLPTRYRLMFTRVPKAFSRNWPWGTTVPGAMARLE